MSTGITWNAAFADLPCVLQTSTCLDGPSTKIIGGFSITRACWKYENTFKCGGVTPLANDCSLLRAQGCFQVGSSCSVKASDGSCDLYDQTYSCPGPAQNATLMQCGNTAFCLTGNCANTAYNNNTDFTQAYGGLAALEAAGKDLDQINFRIFTGVALQCNQYLLNSWDCCDMDGILNGVVLSCSSEEVLLANERKRRTTVYVGSFCSGTSILGACIQNKQTYCDFKSLLARIAQEQGKPQLGLNFGSPQNPDCSGFTIDQFAQLDFNRIDFSEFTSQFTVPNPNSANTATSIQNKLNAGKN